MSLSLLALLWLVFTMTAQATVGESAAFIFDTRDSNSSVAAESAAFVLDTRESNSTHYAESAVFAFDTRAIDGLSGFANSGTFFIDTRGVSAMPPLQITGTVRDTAGAALAGASVELKRYETRFWQGVSGAGGAFTTPQLPAGNFTVIASKTGYVTNIKSLPGGLGGVQSFEVRLTPLPATAATQTVVRTPQESAIRPPLNVPDSLRLFDGTNFTSDLSALSPSRMTVVLSHGWKSGPDEWAKLLASLMRNHHGLAEPPNIVVWDWSGPGRAEAILPPIDRASDEGIELGKALLAALGAGYAQHVHFIGHSLGTIVNSYACDHVHGAFSRASMNPPAHWLPNVTKPHVTLLDEAAISFVAGSFRITGSELSYRAEEIKSALLAGNLRQTGLAVFDWKNPIPRAAANEGWVDNYISAVGFRRSEAVNVCLLAPTLGFDVSAFVSNPVTALANVHGYAHFWYRNTVIPSAPASLLGFSVSAEKGVAFPPVGAGMTVGTDWWEAIATPAIQDVTQTKPMIGFPYTGDFPIVFVVAVVGTGQVIEATGQAVLDSYEARIEYVGEIGGTVIYKSGLVIAATKEKVGLFVDAAQDKANDVLNAINADIQSAKQWAAGTMRIILRKQPAPAQGGIAPFGGESAFAWFTVQVPENAGMMAFDFTVTGDPSEDRIACAINEQNIFTLPAKFAPDGSPVSTDMMDVSAYAGQTVELFFGLSGGTSVDCEVAIDGIRFITIPKPKVAVARAGANVQVKWPAAAGGWLLESSTTLAPGSWLPEPLDSGVSVESGVLTLEQAILGEKKFYRLRGGP